MNELSFYTGYLEGKRRQDEVARKCAEATWQKSKVHHHLTDWLVVTDPPHGMPSIHNHSSEEGAKKQMSHLAKNHPHLAKHSYILPPKNRVPD
jgi:hypothetical protein